MINNTIESANQAASAIEMFYDLLLHNVHKYDSQMSYKLFLEFKAKLDDESKKAIARMGSKKEDFIKKIIDDSIDRYKKANEFVGKEYYNFDKQNFWLNICRFASVFYNDKQVKLIDDNKLSSAIKGKFVPAEMDRKTSIDEYLESVSKNFDAKLSYSILKDIRSMYIRVYNTTHTIIPSYYEDLKDFITYDNNTRTIKSTNAYPNFELLDDGSLMVNLVGSDGLVMSAVVNSKDSEKARMSVIMKTEPLIARKRKDGVLRLGQEATSEELPPEVAFNLFRNANAHGAKQHFNEKKNYFQYTTPQGESIMYTFGWLQGFSHFFLNDSLSRLYGKNTNFKLNFANDNISKAEIKVFKETLINNVFPIVINNIKIDDSIKNRAELKEHLENRVYYNVTINDDIYCSKAKEAIDSVRSELFCTNIVEDKKIQFKIQNILKKYKIKDYTIEKAYPKQPDKLIKYWIDRLEDMGYFYKLTRESQNVVFNEIEDINNYYLSQTVDKNINKFSNKINSILLRYVNNTALYGDGLPYITNEICFKNSELASLALFKQELAFMMSAFTTYNALVTTGFVENLCVNPNGRGFDKIDKKDIAMIMNLDLEGFKYYIHGEEHNIKTLEDRRYLLRGLRDCVAHGNVTTKDRLSYQKDTKNDIVCFNWKKKDVVIEASVDTLMNVFSSKEFYSPSHTQISQGTYSKK